MPATTSTMPRIRAVRTVIAPEATRRDFFFGCARSNSASRQSLMRYAPEATAQNAAKTITVGMSAAASPARCASTSGMKTRRFLLQCSGRSAGTIRKERNCTMRPVTRVRIATMAIVLVWVALMIRLMIADVWDETNGMLAFCDPAHPLGFKIHFVLTQSLGFWRPLPTLICVGILHFIRDFDVNWRILRAIDIAMLAGAALLFTRAVERWSERDDRRDLVFTIALLFSGSAVITAGWYANIFDASALLLLTAGAYLLSRGWFLEAGLVFGIAFFCKETAALVFPFLLLLLAAGRLTFRNALRTGIPALILGAIYFAIRSRIVSFGSSSDVHGFDMKLFLPTLINLGESF